MTRLLLALACTLAVAACGGSDAKKTNAAAEARFTYGTPQAATATQAGTGAASVGVTSGFTSAPGATGGLQVADTSGIVSALLGSQIGTLAAGLPTPAERALALRPRNLTALVDTGLDNPACVTVTQTSVTYAHCTATSDEVVNGGTIHTVFGIDGSISYAAATNTLAWDLTATITMTEPGVSIGGAFHMAGSYTADATTVKGHSGTEFLVTASAGGQSFSMGADESVDIDVTYADAATCATRITSGTIEAKRVITAWPQVQGAPPRPPDAAAKVTWTACGEATVQLGTR